MNKIMYADGDSPQSFKAPPPPVLQEKEEARIRATLQSQRIHRKPRPIEHTRIWVLYDRANTQNQNTAAADPVS